MGSAITIVSTEFLLGYELKLDSAILLTAFRSLVVGNRIRVSKSFCCQSSFINALLHQVRSYSISSSLRQCLVFICVAFAIRVSLYFHSEVFELSENASGLV